MQDLFEADVIRRLTKAGCAIVQQFGGRCWRLPDRAVVTETEALKWLDHQHEHGLGRRARVTPTARTLQTLRKLGYLAAVVESWVPRINVRRDLFGLADILAVHTRDRHVLLVQATSDSNVSARLRKIQGLPAAGEVLRAGLRLEVWGWSQRAGKWQARIVPVVLGQVQVVAARPPRRKATRQRGLFHE